MFYPLKYKVDGFVERYKAKVGCKGIYPDIYNWLSRNLCPGSQDEHHEDLIVLSSTIWLEFTAIWSEKCFFSLFGRRSIIDIPISFDGRTGPGMCAS